MTEKLKEVIYVNWEEYESGWGVRPDGCSLHLTKTDCQNYLKEQKLKETSNEYSRPAGKPVIAYVTPLIYKKIKENHGTLRIWKTEERKLVKEKELVYGKERSGWVSIKKN